MKYVAGIVIILAAVSIADARPTPPPGASPRALDQVLGCRAITDDTKRLACFDQSVRDLQDAAAKRDIVVVDQEQVRETRRSLFGFSLPDIGIFGGGKTTAKNDAGDLKEITAVVRSVRQDASGNWIIVLEDGAIWHQTGGMIAVPPRSGEQVTIKRAALGSYFLRVGKQPGVKARREN